MSKFEFGEVAKQLNAVEENGVTFEDKALTWDTAEHVKDVVAAIKDCKSMQYIKLCGNTLGVDAAAAIGKALQEHPECQKAFWQNSFTRRTKEEIPKALSLLTGGLMQAGACLTVLDLSDNALGPNGMKGLEVFLRSASCYTLRELRLNNCGLGIYGGRMLSEAIIACHNNSVAHNKPLQLKIFIAGRNRLENEGAKALAAMFTKLQTLEEIAMPQNSIYHEGIAALSQSFKHNKELAKLNLNDNTVTTKGAAALADAFASLPKLRDINFGDCLLKTNGAYLFAEALGETHKLLEKVDLGFNEIKSDGGHALVIALQNKPFLEYLQLDGNQFGSDGCKQIIEEVKTFNNPGALQKFEEDASEDEDETENEEDEDDNADEDDEAGEEEDAYDEEHQNDTTEEVDEEEDYEGIYGDNADELSAYTTTTNFAGQVTLANDSSFQSADSAADADCALKSNARSAESFIFSRLPCDMYMFESIEGDKFAALKNVINQFSGDDHLLMLIFTSLKCGHLSKSSSTALEIAMSLNIDVIDYAVKNNLEKRVLTYLLLQLGLLRSAEIFQSKYDLKCCRYALRQTLEKQEIRSELMKKTLTSFLNAKD